MKKPPSINGLETGIGRLANVAACYHSLEERKSVSMPIVKYQAGSNLTCEKLFQSICELIANAVEHCYLITSLKFFHAVAKLSVLLRFCSSSFTELLG